VGFYNQEWSWIGIRRTLASSFETITGLDRDMILWPKLYMEDGLDLRSRLNCYSIAQRMSWASEREATRLEDRAYSLLGLFDINMPLLYGEGRKAFVRLQEEIIRKSTDQSIFAWNKPGLELSAISAAKLRQQSLIPDPRRLFARSPSEFQACRDVIPAPHIVETRSDQGYSLSNAGLQINVPVVIVKVDEYEQHYAILNCALQDDLSGPLALRLLTLPAEEGQNVYQVATPLEGRIGPVPLERIPADIAGTSVLLKTDPVDGFGRPYLSERTELARPIFRVHVDSEVAVVVQTTYPVEHTVSYFGRGDANRNFILSVRGRPGQASGVSCH
jgi:hypothetical protein